LSDLICSRSQIEEIKPHLRPSTITRLLNFSLRISKAKKWLSNYSLNAFYNKFIRRFGYLQHVLDQNDIFIINHLNVFYSELKRLSLSKNFSLDQFLKRIDLLTENRLPLSAPELNSEIDGAIRIMTVHGSKGLEFEHVFLIKCADKNWGNNARTSTIRLPYGIIKTEISLLANDDNEEERRLFYVALTRAKNQIYISYSRKNETDHEQNPSIFTAEIDPKLIQIIHADPDIQKEALIASVPLTDATPDLSRQLQKYLKHFLATDYKFNITHLNSYLRCPLCFYYKTILKIPSVKDKYAALGTAIHNSLSYLFDNLKADKKLISEKQLLKIYSKFLLHENLSPMEFSESLNRGNQILSEYYQNYHDSFDCDCLTEFDFAAEHVHLDDIPLTGKIDKVEILKTSKDGVKDVNVVDFKTGNPDTKSKELKEDGEYFRQLVFYKILADSDPSFNYNVVSGTIDFVQKSKYKKNFVKKDFVVTEKQVEDLKKLIKEVYQKILNLEFQKIGDNCPDRNHLHYLLETHETSNQKVR
jgi:DNA helicase-2/ATP-dependent DNA helicase PcrA